jgi:ribonucleoside-diphosphate reductase alpha chain
MLNSVVDDNVISEVPTVANGNDWFKSIGIGGMNQHGYLVKNGVKYSDVEHNVDFSRTFWSTVRFYAIKHSMLLAKETGEKFKDFEKSEYFTGEVFKPYIDEWHAPRTDKVFKLFDGIHIPFPTEWEELWQDVRKYGMRNAYLMAIAPTGSISYIQNATASVLPITEKIETRTYGDLTTVYPMPYLREAFFLYESAFDIDPTKVIAVIAEIQKHVDQGISMTLFVPSDITTRQLVRYYLDAWVNNLKSVYYLRTNLKNETEDCESCVV